MEDEVIPIIDLGEVTDGIVVFECSSPCLSIGTKVRIELSEADKESSPAQAFAENGERTR